MEKKNMPTGFCLTIVVDNRAEEGLMVEHGLSLWIEAGEHRFLFDTGQGPALSDNLRALKIDVATATHVVLSHGHYDHTGGLPWVAETARAGHVFAHPLVTKSRYSLRGGTPRPIRMPGSSRGALLKMTKENRTWVEGPLMITPDIGLTGPIPRVTDFETTGGPFFLDPEGRTADPIEDDLALWIRTPKGLAVIVGCCHSGLINTLLAIRGLSGGEPIRLVIGGFHLGEASDHRIARTIAALKDFGSPELIPCHCTGEHAQAALIEVFGQTVTPGRAGLSFMD